MNIWYSIVGNDKRIKQNHSGPRLSPRLGQRMAQIVLAWVFLGLIVLSIPALMTASGSVAPIGNRAGSLDAVADLLAHMSVADRVGQLFIVPVWGNDTGLTSDAAQLLLDYRVGGIVLMPSNMNFRNDDTAVEQVSRLTRQFQVLAQQSRSQQPGSERNHSSLISSVQNMTSSLAIAATGALTAGDLFIPLFLVAEYEGDGYPYTSIRGGLTPLPSNMAVGATWKPETALAMGEIAGHELHAMGVNVLLGPVLDVLATPRPALKGDLGIRSFGGSAPWVGKLGRAYIEGVHKGAQGQMLTVAKHFPGLGAADRRLDEEIPTVPKSLGELKDNELVPFMEVTAGGDTTSRPTFATPGDSDSPITDALMSGHIRYRGFQGNSRQLTRPISLDPQNLETLLEEPEFMHWREQGGLMMSDDLGIPAVRRYYDPQQQSFPYKRIAQDAFLAGNDLLLLAHFGLTDTWSEQFENVKATIQFFQEKYVTDQNFQAKVDQSVRRILGAKQRMYGDLDHRTVITAPSSLVLDRDGTGRGNAAVFQVAKDAMTLLYPSIDELTERLPNPPSYGDNMVIFTESSGGADCESCSSESRIAVDAVERVMDNLYGPKGSGQIDPEKVHSLSFAQLKGFLLAPSGAQVGSAAEIGALISSADWLIFAMQEVNNNEIPSSDALKMFLRLRSDNLRSKKTVVLALGAPYYLDTTEIGKLTAYYGVYSKEGPFIEAAVRAIFQEYTPSGFSPVSVEGVNYDLTTQTSPNPDQIIELRANVSAKPKEPTTEPLMVSPLLTPATPGVPVDVNTGSTLQLQTGIILDRNGHPVPDGTPVTFGLSYPMEAVELPRRVALTINGMAETSVMLDRPGQLEITAASGPAANSTVLVITIQGEKPGTITTLAPGLISTTTLATTDTTSTNLLPGGALVPTNTLTRAVGSPSGPATGSRSRLAPRVQYTDLWLTLICIVVLNIAGDILRLRKGWTRVYRLRLSLMGLLFGLLGYLIYALGIVGTWSLWRIYGHWGAMLFGACLSVIPLTTVLIARGIRATR